MITKKLTFNCTTEELKLIVSGMALFITTAFNCTTEELKYSYFGDQKRTVAF